MKVPLQSELFSQNQASSAFHFVCDDSREDPKDCAFLCTQSSSKYLKQAKERGFLHFITPKDLKQYWDLNLKIIGITGTNGKTTTAAMIYSILIDMGYKVGLLGTRGFFIQEKQIRPKGLTTPCLLEIYSAIAQAKAQGCEYFVMEVSSHAIVQNRIEGLDFALKILTNITGDHLDYHKTLENYIAVKNAFFADSQTKKLINKDEPNAHYTLNNTQTYGIENPATLNVKAYSLTHGITAQINYGKEEAHLDLELFGKYNLYNALAAIGAVKILEEKPLCEITKALENFGGVKGRMQIVSTKPLIIVDFAHTHDGMEKIFQAFLHQDIVVVFGAGGDRDRTKRPKMGLCAASFAKRIYITSDNPRSENPQTIMQEILGGIPETLREKRTIILEENRSYAIKAAVQSLKANEILLVLGKGDETYQILGDKTIEFDDSQEILKALEN